MVRNSTNMICAYEWTILLSHSEGFLVPDTRRVDVAKRSQVQDVRQQQHFWLASKAALITLPEAGAGRFPVSFGQWGMFRVFFVRWLALARVSLSLGDSTSWRTGERESCERVTGEKWSRGNERVNLSLQNCTSIPLAWACSPDATCECQAINQAVI